MNRIVAVVGMLLLAVLTTGCSTPSYDRTIGRALHERRPEDFLDKAVVGPHGDGAYVVATTQVIESAGKSVVFPGRPTDVALSPDGKLLAVKRTRHSTGRAGIEFVDMTRQEVCQSLELPEGETSFCGLAWSDQALWITDASGTLRSACRETDGTFAWRDAIRLPGPKGDGASAPGGVYIDETRGHIYVTLSRNNSVAVLDPSTLSIVCEVPVGIAPYTVVRCGDALYVTNWGGRQPRPEDQTGPSGGSKIVVDRDTGVASTGTVSVIDIGSRTVVKEIAVGLHPSGMATSPDGQSLYVANANSDTISVIDTARRDVVRTLSTKPLAELPFGSAPNAVAVSPDGATLYVANGGNNAVAVLECGSGTLRGLIPTGWYPGALALAGNGTLLCVANIKGTGANDPNPVNKRRNPEAGKGVDGYNSYDALGSVSLIRVPGTQELDEYTYRAACNMRLPLMERIMNGPPAAKRAVPVPTRPGEISHFKHVLYIIKENRTYDQVFGDMPQGNSEPSFCLFGREVTPNHHALAEEFVLLDNFYCNGVLSADGHQWTDEGYVTDYLEKSFGGWARSYPYEGDDALAFASPGFIWDYVLRKGLTFRDYGEFVRAEIEPATSMWADIYADYVQGTTNVKIRATSPLHTLEPYLCPTYVGFPGKVQDIYRAREFIKELRASEATGEWPNFMIMLLPNDHTAGTREGMPTPRAMVADNDLALGQIVEAVSHSRFWAETAIFVVEDDPQAGVDHVDGHRTVALCVSPYTRRGQVDSHHYNQTGMLRTIELIFGIAPMNQLTMAANPMLGCFQETPDLRPYDAKPNGIALNEMNRKVAGLRGKERYYAKQSMALPLDDVDMADEDVFNRIIWHAVKGVGVPYPASGRRFISHFAPQCRRIEQ